MSERRVLIARFSQSGTIERVAQRIAAGFRLDDYDVDHHRIQDRTDVDINKYDLIGIGFPVYIFRVPFIVRDYIKSLPPLNGKPFFIFMLYGSLRGTAGNMARRLMESKGGEEVGYSYYTGDDVYYGYLRMGYLFSPGHPTDDGLKAAFEFSKRIHKVLSGSEPYKKPRYDPLPDSVFRMERILTSRFLIKYLYRHFFTVSRMKCRRCGTCLTNCHTENISFNRHGFPVFGTKCICCWYSEMRCPAEAITTTIDWPLLNLFNRYNISRTLKANVVEHTRVKLSKGCVKRTGE